MANAPATAEDRTALAAGFEPETILPSQLLDRSHLGAALQPEKRLMLAVLEDAVATFQRGTVSKTRQAARDFDEVGTWFASDDVPESDPPWVVIVWNDPVNLMSYVTWVLQKLFGYPRTRAEKLMMDVHTKGKAVVSNGTREKAEFDVARLHAHGLWATMQKDA
jgi:ATP-dependent Clp protease adaptor protein ClpS